MKKDKKEITLSNRTSTFAELKEYDYFAKEHDYAEVTEWTNGEGYDIDINGKKHISLTYGEFKAIKKLIKKLNTRFIE